MKPRTRRALVWTVLVLLIILQALCIAVLFAASWSFWLEQKVPLAAVTFAAGCWSGRRFVEQALETFTRWSPP